MILIRLVSLTAIKVILIYLISTKDT